MRHEPIAAGLLAIIILSSAGCSTWDAWRFRLAGTASNQAKLEQAVGRLASGSEQQARELLEQVINTLPEPGVTDEALFRLALLNLRDENSRSILRAQSLLERLSAEYPASIWTKQSAQLLTHLAEVRLLRNRLRDLKNLKEQNISLSRNNRELRQSLERLKQLDLELEQKLKR